MSDLVLTDETWLDDFGNDCESSSTSLADKHRFLSRSSSSYLLYTQQQAFQRRWGVDVSGKVDSCGELRSRQKSYG